MSPDVTQQFREATARPDVAIDLGWASLQIGRTASPELDVERYVLALDDLAALVSQRGARIRGLSPAGISSLTTWDSQPTARTTPTHATASSTR